MGPGSQPSSKSWLDITPPNPVGPPRYPVRLSTLDPLLLHVILGCASSTRIWLSLTSFPSTTTLPLAASTQVVSGFQRDASDAVPKRFSLSTASTSMSQRLWE